MARSFLLVVLFQLRTRVSFAQYSLLIFQVLQAVGSGEVVITRGKRT